jgi:uncharacterized ferritin-like protein (DUF455 family)
MLARRVARDWRLGRIDRAFDAAMPDRPVPGPAPLLSATRVKSRGRAGSLASRIAILHAVAHIEYVAIDLAFDLVGRFGAGFPRSFVDDWLRVGAEEAMHFAILDRRLHALGSLYGAFPVHGGLWEAAEATADDALARLAVVPMVLEARGLDVTPQMIARFESAGDAATARLLRRILNDEVRHVAAGVRWFEKSADEAGFVPVEAWQRLISERFGGALKPPFNDSARGEAGLTMDYYMRVAVPDPGRHT